MTRARLISALVTIGLLLTVVVSVLVLAGPEALRDAFSSLALPSLLVVAALLAAGILLSSLRLKMIATDVGYPLSFRESARVLTLGQLAGTVFFQIAGQLIARGVVLSRQGVPAAATIVISGYERVIALSVSLILAAGGAIYLFGKLSFDWESGGYSLIKLACGLVLATAAGGLLAWGSSLLRVFRSFNRVGLLRLLRSFFVSAGIQLTTLAAYVVLGKTVSPNIGILPLAAASSVVMLAASMPISLGGWGMREMSAVLAMQVIGLTSASALIVALLIGTLSLALVAATAIALMFVPTRSAKAVPAPIPATVPDYGAALDWSLPLIAATAVFFQVYLPTPGGLLNVNLADPIVLIAAALFVVRHFGKAWPSWRLPGLNVHVGLATAVILVSFVHGWVSFGWSDWAFTNKTLGWFMLLCYGATGALIVRRADGEGLNLLLTTFAAVGAALALLDVAGTSLLRAGFREMRSFVDFQITGFSQNPNAFGFALLLVLSSILVMRVNDRARIGLAAFTLAGLWFTGSRAALGTTAVLIVCVLLIGIRRRLVLSSLVGATAVIICVGFVPDMVALFTSAPGGGGNRGPTAQIFRSLMRRASESEWEHLLTIKDGLSMFWSNPLWGAGLGAYIAEQLRGKETALVIHSTPIWLLAETGLIGFVVFASAVIRIGWSELSRLDETAGRLLLLILCVFVTMSTIHELLYQRALWLLLGAALAMPVESALAKETSGLAKAQAYG